MPDRCPLSFKTILNSQRGIRRGNKAVYPSMPNFVLAFCFSCNSCAYDNFVRTIFSQDHVLSHGKMGTFNKSQDVRALDHLFYCRYRLRPGFCMSYLAFHSQSYFVFITHIKSRPQRPNPSCLAFPKNTFTSTYIFFCLFCSILSAWLLDGMMGLY